MPPNGTVEILVAIAELRKDNNNFITRFEEYLKQQAERDRKQDDCLVDLSKRVRSTEDEQLKNTTRIATIVAVASGVGGFIGITGTIVAKSFHII